jgi:hypothetical protein
LGMMNASPRCSAANAAAFSRVDRTAAPYRGENPTRAPWAGSVGG